MVMLERGDRARDRGARIYGYVVGYAAVAEAYHPSSPQPDGTYEKRAIRQALADAELEPDAIDVVMAHGTGTPVGDAAEIHVINEVFDRSGDPVIATSVKGSRRAAAAARPTALPCSPGSGGWPMVSSSPPPGPPTSTLTSSFVSRWAQRPPSAASTTWW